MCNRYTSSPWTCKWYDFFFFFFFILVVAGAGLIRQTHLQFKIRLFAVGGTIQRGRKNSLSKIGWQSCRAWLSRFLFFFTLFFAFLTCPVATVLKAERTGTSSGDHLRTIKWRFRFFFFFLLLHYEKSVRMGWFPMSFYHR